MSVNYGNFMAVGLYREETGIECGAGGGSASGDITVSTPVELYCHSKFQNAAHVESGETFNLGVAWLRNTTDSTWNTVDVSAVSGDAITIGAGHDTDIFSIGYYAKGTGVAAASQSIQDGDIWRKEHMDNLYTAMNVKGNVDPTECGYVFDNAMAYRSMPAISTTEVEAVSKQSENIVGTWSFSNYHVYYVTGIRVEVNEAGITPGQGVKVHVYESDAEILESAGSTGIPLNHHSGWWAAEHDDGVGVWYQGQIFLGMCLSSNFKVTIETNGTNPPISAGDCRVFLSGWHIPDPVDEADGVLDAQGQDPSSVFTLGAYREEVQEVGSDLTLDFTDQWIAFHTAGAMRTNPHHRGEFMSGVEFCKNLTTDEFITMGIIRIDYNTIQFMPGLATAGDMVEVGYYSINEFSSKWVLADGDLMHRAVVDGLILGMKRFDRVDWGDGDFPYGDGEYEWSPNLWYKVVHGEENELYAAPLLTNSWQSLLNFNVEAFESRDFSSPSHFGSDRSSYNEAPFYLTGITVSMNAVAVSGGATRYDRIILRITVNGAPVNQGGSRDIFYIPAASASEFAPVPTPLGVSSQFITSDLSPAVAAEHQLHIPLGLVRAHSVKVEARCDGVVAFDTVHERSCFIEGWMPGD